MNLFAQLTVGLIAAIAATAAITQIPLTAELSIAGSIFAACALAPVLQALLSRRGSPRSSATGSGSGAREEGEVKWFNTSKGFGFIRRDNDEEIFVHFRSIREGKQGRRGLHDGQRVSYIVVDSDKGPQAEDVAEL